MKGLFIPEITAEMFRNGCLESIETLMAEGEICDIDYQQPCEDAIRREDALMALTGEWTEPTDELIHRFIKRIRNLPPVSPLPKTGKWIPDDTICEDTLYRCSNCDNVYYSNYGDIKDMGYNYCPNCGAKMESEVEE